MFKLLAKHFIKKKGLFVCGGESNLLKRTRGSLALSSSLAIAHKVYFFYKEKNYFHTLGTRAVTSPFESAEQISGSIHWWDIKLAFGWPRSSLKICWWLDGGILTQIT